MELIFTPSYSTHPETHFVHPGYQFSLNTQTLLRANNGALYPKMFFYLNWYFNQISEEEQKRVIQLYAQVEELLRKNDDMATVNGDIRDIFAELLEVLDADKIYRWIKPADKYPWPSASELPRSYAEAVSPKYPEEKTYVLSEYQQLFALILQLRACAPIWAAYLNKFGSKISSDFRDMVLVSLLDRSNISETPAWQRLQRYIAAWLGSKDDNYTTGVIHGVSAEEYPRWFLCQALLRKLMLQTLTSPTEGDASPFVIKHLSNYIRECIQKTPSQFNTPKLKPTNNRDDQSGNDSDRSVYEANRVKENVARGERWTIQIYLEDYKQALIALEPEIDMEQASRIVEGFDASTYIPSPEQMLIALWVLSPIVSPRSEDDLTRLNSVTVCAVATAVLWHRGHKEVAVLLSSERGAPITRSGFSTAAGTRLSRETYQKLSEIYPKADRPKNTGNAYNPVREICIDVVTESQTHVWMTKLPQDILLQASNLFLDGQFNVLRVAQNMTTALVDMVIDIAQRPLKENAWDKATRIAKELGLPDQPVPWPVSVPPERPLNGSFTSQP